MISILGAKTKDLLLLEKEIDEFSDEFYIATDDGSKGHKGFVSDVLQKVIDKQEGRYGDGNRSNYHDEGCVQPNKKI